MLGPILRMRENIRVSPLGVKYQVLTVENEVTTGFSLFSY